MKNPFEDLFDTTIAGVFDPETVGAPEEVVEKLLPLLRPLLQEDGPLGSELGDEYQVAYALVWFAQYVFKRGVYDPVEIMHCRSLEAQRPRVTRTPFHVWGYKRGTGSKSNDVHMLVDVEPDDISPYVVAEKIAGDDYIFVSSCYCHELVPSTSGTSSCRPPSCTRRSQHSWRRKTMQSENIFVDAFDVTIAGVHDPETSEEPQEVVERLLPLVRRLLRGPDGPLSDLPREEQVAYALVWFAQFVFKRGIYDPVGIMYQRGLEAQQRPKSRRSVPAA